MYLGIVIHGINSMQHNIYPHYTLCNSNINHNEDECRNICLNAFATSKRIDDFLRSYSEKTQGSPEKAWKIAKFGKYCALEIANKNVMHKSNIPDGFHISIYEKSKDGKCDYRDIKEYISKNDLLHVRRAIREDTEIKPEQVVSAGKFQSARSSSKDSHRDSYKDFYKTDEL